ncbi:Uncharacterised protein [Mycobacteroides abscessus subsp. abscessus]|nr:Uncharacterised protein [Mycobacteroides abscessus subsp. abscessus]
MLITRPKNCERNCGPRIFINPADTTRSGRCTAVAAAIAASHWIALWSGFTTLWIAVGHGTGWRAHC